MFREKFFDKNLPQFLGETVIFYTLQGPAHTLEIHHDKLRFINNTVLSFFSRRPRYVDFRLEDIVRFEITVPQYIVHGKLEWEMVDGMNVSFKFSTDVLMVEKIEKYFKKVILKRHGEIVNGTSDVQVNLRYAS